MVKAVPGTRKPEYNKIGPVLGFFPEKPDIY